jgi:hypothetical protein
LEDEEMRSASKSMSDKTTSVQLPSEDEEMGLTSSVASARATANKDGSEISPEAHRHFLEGIREVCRKFARKFDCPLSLESGGEYASENDNYADSVDEEDRSPDASEMQKELASMVGDRESDEDGLICDEPKRCKKRNAGLELRRVGPRAKQIHREEAAANRRACAKRKRKEGNEMGPPKSIYRARRKKGWDRIWKRIETRRLKK